VPRSVSSAARSARSLTDSFAIVISRSCGMAFVESEFGGVFAEE
jgi:hypothetical protein